jgi:phosphomannomutase
MKLVVKGAHPVSGDSGLDDMAEIIVKNIIPGPSGKPGVLSLLEDKSKYISHLLNYVKGEELKPFKIVVNSGNGCSGAIIDLLEEHLPFEFVKVYHEADGSFPNGVPNPLLPEKREETGRVVRESGADFGVAWDGDFDRCFLWDENGRYIEGYYIVGLLALELLAKEPGAKILHDPRLIWNTKELVKEAGGIPIMTKTGHAFIKERMRKEDALYGGEMSAHHYFRDFGYCDSGMIPWLLIASLLGRKDTSLSKLVASRIFAYPVSGEINSVVTDPDKVIADIKEYYLAGKIDLTDGVSISFDTFRFNVRKSNTEPLLRLNVESRGNSKLLEEKTNELRGIIGKFAKM